MIALYICIVIIGWPAFGLYLLSSEEHAEVRAVLLRGEAPEDKEWEFFKTWFCIGATFFGPLFWLYVLYFAVSVGFHYLKGNTIYFFGWLWWKIRGSKS